MSESESAGHAVALAQAALAGKADDLVLIDVSELTLLADYFLILTGMSDRHVRALAERLADDGRERGRKPLCREGERLGYAFHEKLPVAFETFRVVYPA